jgi:cellulose synthase/poly-beta-1,6-N-acetylglucosamine synthase-like glycosyltransferase
MNTLEVTAIVSGAVLFYAYAGYCMILWLLAGLKHNADSPGGASASGKSISVILCTRNSADRIEARIKNLLSQENLTAQYEILVASDGSTDDTAERAKKTAAESGSGLVRVFEFPNRRGKSAVLNELIPLCRGELVVFCDVRQDFAPDAVSRLASALADESRGAVSGALVLRRSGKESAGGTGVARYWDFEKSLRELESRAGSVCGCTGAIYAIRRNMFVPIHPDTVLDDVAIPMLIAMKGGRVSFESGAIALDSCPDDMRGEMRRKIRTLAGNYQLCALYPAFLNPFLNPLFLQFVSHKLLRLVSPWLLLVLLISSAALAWSSTLWFVFMMAQAAWYSAGALGLILPLYGVRSTALSLPAGFLGLNLFAALALFHFLSGRTKAVW